MEKRCLFLITLFGFIGLIISDSIAQDAIWITNFGSNNVTKLTPDGTTVETFAVGRQPYDPAIDASGSAWVTNWGSSNVTKFNPDGTMAGTFTVGRQPSSIAVDGAGNVWVVNRGSNNVTKLEPDGIIVCCDCFFSTERSVE